MKSLITILYIIFAQVSYANTQNEIFNLVRCPTCEGQSLAESNADIAVDIKNMIREKIKSGTSKEDILKDMQIKFGDDILQKPPVKNETFLLWFGPYIIFSILTLIGIRHFLKGKKHG